VKTMKRSASQKLIERLSSRYPNESPLMQMKSQKGLNADTNFAHLAQHPSKFHKFDRVNDKLIASLKLNDGGHKVMNFRLDW